MNEISLIEKKYLKAAAPEFQVGDFVRVSLKVQEGDKTRTQAFEGTVIRKRGSSVGASFTVLKETKGSEYTVEKTFPVHSPTLEKVKVLQTGNVKKAKLYHMRRIKKTELS